MGLTASLPGAPTSYSGTSAYQYDGHDQLKNEQSSRLGSYTNAFSYDGAGNPTTFRGVDPTGGKGYTPDNQNAAFPFDKDGNPTSWQGNALTFDAGNHLTKLVNGAVTVLTAGYNAEGLRAWKQSAAGSTYYVYDGLTPVVELDGNGNVTAVNTWGAAGLAGRYTTAGSGSSTFYTFDVQGSVSQRLSSNGTVQGTYGFDSYGNRVGTDNSADPYSGFGAQWGYIRDGETGLSLCGERYYDAGQGRFLNRDPIGYGGGLNVYAYVGSNPLDGTDSTGTQRISCEDSNNPGGCMNAFGVDPSGHPLPDLEAAAAEQAEAEEAVRTSPTRGLDPLPLSNPEPADTQSEDNGDEVLYRLGKYYEKAGRLNDQASAARDAPNGIGTNHVKNLFGVSVSTTQPAPGKEFSSAYRRDIEKIFPLWPTPTRNDPGHHTLELPDPCTSEAASLFNSIFGRKR